MFRRQFIRTVLALIGAAPATAKAVSASQPEILLQHSPVAGFQYHEGETVWAALAEGHALELVREPGNAFDDRAVRIEWHGRKLGYLPREENCAVAQLLDRGESPRAQIAKLTAGVSSWERVRIEVFLSRA